MYLRNSSRIMMIGLFLFLCIESTLKAKSNVEITGDVLLFAIPSGALAYSYFQDDYDGNKQFIAGFLTNTVATQSLKYSVQKPRPDKSDNLSFPSGHTSTTFQAATFIHYRYGLEYSAVAYFGAIFTGYSRIDAKKHYLEDVLAGALIGTLSSFMTVNPKPDIIKISAFYQSGIFGVQLKKRW